MEKNNKLIAEFMGYKLAKCNNGLAWKSPYKKSVEDTFELHGRLWRENDSYYKFHTSWDWLMPVVQKCRQENRLEYFDFVYYAIETCDINITYKAVVEFIKNQNN